jgi:protein-S-isoprenylcysteine O-methyltransferase Ste14
MPSGSFYRLAVLQVIAGILLLTIAFFAPGPWNWERGVGIALMVVGLLGIGTARFQLGTSFSVTAQARHLVTHGIYSKIRNPIYVFGALLFAGFILVLHRPFLWLLFVVMIVVQIIRAHREAQVLEAAFGDEYREYRRKTWF